MIAEVASESRFNVPPEHVLWLAVIEKAIIDYCWPTKDVNIDHRRSLQWFFFSETPEPNNLLYICELLFADQTMACQILKRIEKLKASNITEAEFVRARSFKSHY